MIIVTSEVCTKEDRVILKEAFNLPVKSEYGASEFGYIGCEIESGLWKIAQELLYVETTKNGSLLITDLFNKAFPFIKYRIGDIAKVKLLNNGDQVIQDLKVEKMILLNYKWKNFAGLTFYYISRSLLESTGILKEFIITQKTIDRFVFDVVSDRPLNQNEVDKIKLNAEKYLEKDLKIEINNVKKIDRPFSGKIKHFYSELKS